MSFVPYILSSLLLSGIGGGVYLLFRWIHPGAQPRRFMIWLVILASLLIPLSPQFEIELGTHETARSGEMVHSGTGLIPPAGQTLNEFCHCANPQTGDVIMYQASRIYDTLLAHSTWIFLLLLSGSLFFVLRQAIGMIRLVRRVKQFPTQNITLDGRKIKLVRGPHPVGALRFGGRYIFWHPELDALAPAEQQAILRHEFSHLRQHNTLEKLLLAALQGIWFMNPALYLFRRELELLSEYTADAYGARYAPSRKHYAHLLLTVKSRPEFAMGSFFKGSILKKRIEYLLGKKNKARLALLPAALIGLGLLFSSDLIAQQAIHHQIQEIAVYEFMHEQNEATGQEEFCYKCTLEAIECE